MTMKQFRKTTAAAVAGLGALALLAAPTFAGGDHGGTDQVQLTHMGQGDGWTGRAGHMGMMGRGYSMGPGTMMGPDVMMGPGMMTGPAEAVGGCPGSATTIDKDLDADGVRSSIERSLDWHGNKRLKVGEVKEIGNDMIIAEIVTLDGSLVQRLEVDRRSGAMQQID